MTVLAAWLATLRGSLTGARPGRVSPFRVAAIALFLLAATTVAVGFLEGPTGGLADASPLYLVAVVVAGIVSGTIAAVLTAAVAFVTYDFLFTEPRYTFVIADPRQWLDLVVLFGVALVIGRLTARETDRAGEATARAREAEVLFGISRHLASAATYEQAAEAIAWQLAGATEMGRLWLAAPAGASQEVVADTDSGKPFPVVASAWTLMGGEKGEEPRWVAVHTGSAGRRPTIDRDVAMWTVPLRAEGTDLGTLNASRPRGVGAPRREETRLLAAAADQLALGLRRRQLDRQAAEAEIARQSDLVKSALLDSVSHDLRTPLASIRATAGSLMDPAITWAADERRTAARMIDAEADRMSHLVQSVLDLSRIQGGALQPQLEVLDIAEVVEPILERMDALRDGHPIELELAQLPPVEGDAVLLDTALANLIENALRHSSPGAVVRIGGSVQGEVVQLAVEDGGPGVPDDAMPRLFGRFYRVPGRARGSRPGLGIGLSIVQGFVEAMGGHVAVGRSELGGLRVAVTLPIAPEAPAP